MSNFKLKTSLPPDATDQEKFEFIQNKMVLFARYVWYTFLVVAVLFILIVFLIR